MHLNPFEFIPSFPCRNNAWTAKHRSPPIRRSFRFAENFLSSNVIICPFRFPTTHLMFFRIKDIIPVYIFFKKTHPRHPASKEADFRSLHIYWNDIEFARHDSGSENESKVNKTADQSVENEITITFVIRPGLHQTHIRLLGQPIFAFPNRHRVLIRSSNRREKSSFIELTSKMNHWQRLGWHWFRYPLSLFTNSAAPRLCNKL